MSVASRYRWGIGVSPVLVDLDLGLIDRLRQEISRGPLIEDRQSEIGGLLLGTTHDDVVHISDFRLVPSEHRRGASFDLSPRDRIGLQRNLAKYHNRRVLQVVGYFRTHTRPGLYLDETDHTVACDYFANPSQVFLLIRPDDPPQAGFFFWEDGEINRKQSYLPFPFESNLPAHQPEAHEDIAPSRQPVFIPPVETVPRQRSAFRSGLLLLPFAVGGLAAFVVPWLNDRHPAQQTRRTEVQSRQSADKRPEARVTIPGPGRSVRLKRIAPAIPIRPDQPKMEIPSPRPRAVQTAPDPPALTAKVAPPDALNSLPKTVHHPLAASPINAGVDFEPMDESIVRRTINRVPLLSQMQHHSYKAGDDFVPARPIHDPKPIVPNSVARALTGLTPVDVRLTVAKDGRVSQVLLLSKNSDAQLRDIVLGTATRWNFDPARIKGKPVDSRVVAHFRFEPR